MPQSHSCNRTFENAAPSPGHSELSHPAPDSFNGDVGHSSSLPRAKGRGRLRIIAIAYSPPRIRSPPASAISECDDALIHSQAKRQEKLPSGVSSADSLVTNLLVCSSPVLLFPEPWEHHDGMPNGPVKLPGPPTLPRRSACSERTPTLTLGACIRNHTDPGQLQR